MDGKWLSKSASVPHVVDCQMDDRICGISTLYMCGWVGQYLVVFAPTKECAAEKRRRISALARRSARDCQQNGNVFQESILPQVVDILVDDVISI